MNINATSIATQRTTGPARRKKLGLLGLVLGAWLLGNAGSLSAASGTPVAELREPLFEKATAALSAANAVNAAILAPQSYSAGGEAYRRAEKTLAEAGSIDVIRREVDRATEAFVKATEAAGKANTAFGGTVRARDDAESAEAEKYAPEAWRSAEVEFFDATSALEKGRERSAERAAEKALERYRSAELDAIKANYLNETRSLLEQAEELRAERYAPQSFAAATQTLATAETALTENRYDTDRPRNLAQQAKHSARHAIYVSRLANQIRKGDLKLETLLLDWEASISKVAQQIDLPVYFDDGEGQALAAIQDGIVQLQTQLTARDAALNERNEQIAAMNSQMSDLQQNLGDKSAAAERLNAVLRQQEQNRQRFAAVEGLFAVDQASVLRKGSTVIVRLIGLTFDSGKAELKEQHPALLDLLTQAMSQFPGSSVVIEGHTDSFGSDAVNLELSQQRADAVESYLQSRGVASDQLTALGYGESQPLANNETAEGRRRNRRIDVVIYP
ncbi:MAG: OmpA family protein [Pseudomonadales bacterium]